MLYKERSGILEPYREFGHLNIYLTHMSRPANSYGRCNSLRTKEKTYMNWHQPKAWLEEISDTHQPSAQNAELPMKYRQVMIKILTLQHQEKFPAIKWKILILKYSKRKRDFFFFRIFHWQQIFSVFIFYEKNEWFIEILRGKVVYDCIGWSAKFSN